MRKVVLQVVTPSAALAMLVLVGSPGNAETNCTSKSGPCIDAKTGETRLCTTTTCYDKDGKEISSTTIVTRQVGTTGPMKPKVPKAGMMQDLPVTKNMDKASP